MIPMIQRAVEITGDGRHLHKDRGFLVIANHGEELGRLPLDDLEVVLFAGHGMTCTSELLLEFANRCIPFILCDHRFLPLSMMWPVESHTRQSGRIRAQADLSEPARKRLWQQVVRAKIAHQHQALMLCTGIDNPRLKRLGREVKSGDTGNCEGEAARLYFPLLFGPAFRRDRFAGGVNALLNYGYTVLRAAVVRAIMLAGLHPAFSLHHRNLRDTLPLADDIIEPFRPVCDVLVYALAAEMGEDAALDRNAKTQLAGLAAMDMVYQKEVSPVSECMLRMTRSLAEVCEGDRRKLILPDGLHAPDKNAPP
jgi:CRISP-associated protein Cas1